MTTIRRVFALAAACVLIAGLAAVTARVARAYPVSSDDATGVLEAEAVLRGNVLLGGWSLSNVSFVTTDLPFYVAALAIRGPRPSLLRDVPAVVYAAAVAAAAVLARGHLRGGRGLLAVGAVAVLLGMPAGGLAEFVTKGYTRVGTTIGLFTALIVLDKPRGRRGDDFPAGMSSHPDPLPQGERGPDGGRIIPRTSPLAAEGPAPGALRLAFFAASLSLTILADTYTLVIGALAILAVCLRGVIFKGTYENVRPGRVAVAVLVSVASARGLAWMIGAVGGYTVAPLPLREYLPWPDPLRIISANAWSLAANLPSVYRCGLPTEVLPVWLGCLIGPALMLVALELWRRPRPADFVADVLVVSMLLGLLAYLGSGNAKDRGTIRYMVPFVLSGAVLTARVLSGRLGDVRPLSVGLGLLGLAYAVTVAEDLRRPPTDDPAAALAGWLDAHDLRHGYGPYWDASIVSASSGGRVGVRPVRGRPVAPGRLVIEPFRWMSDARWYDEGPATFVVFRPNPAPKYHFLVNERTCASCFGPASARHAVGPYVVLVWDRDLRPMLVRGLPWVP